MSEPKPPHDPKEVLRKKLESRAKSNANLNPAKKGEIRNPKGRPAGAQQLHDAVLEFFFHDGTIEFEGDKKKALEVFLQGLVIRSREDIEYARLTLELIAGKTAAASGDFPGLPEGGRTYIRRERLLEIYREAQGDGGMKMIDVETKAGEGGNGNGTGAAH